MIGANKIGKIQFTIEIQHHCHMKKKIYESK